MTHHCSLTLGRTGGGVGVDTTTHFGKDWRQSVAVVARYDVIRSIR